MRIDRIEKSKHKQERVLVFLEEGDLLRITGAELLRFGLYTGMDLPPELVVELQAAAQRSELKQTAARMASGQMLSNKEVQRRLTKKGIGHRAGGRGDGRLAGIAGRGGRCRVRRGHRPALRRHGLRRGAGAAGAAPPGRARRSCGTTALAQLPPTGGGHRTHFWRKKLRGRGMTAGRTAAGWPPPCSGGALHWQRDHALCSTTWGQEIEE